MLCHLVFVISTDGTMVEVCEIALNAIELKFQDLAVNFSMAKFDHHCPIVVWFCVPTFVLSWLLLLFRSSPSSQKLQCPYFLSELLCC